MNRSEAREAADIMLAYADGKEIEWKDRSSCRNNGEWVSNNLMHFNWENNDYRIKPEQKYRPFKNGGMLAGNAKTYSFWMDSRQG